MFVCTAPVGLLKSKTTKPMKWKATNIRPNGERVWKSSLNQPCILRQVILEPPGFYFKSSVFFSLQPVLQSRQISFFSQRISFWSTWGARTRTDLKVCVQTCLVRNNKWAQLSQTVMIIRNCDPPKPAGFTAVSFFHLVVTYRLVHWQVVIVTGHNSSSYYLVLLRGLRVFTKTHWPYY